MALLPRTTTTSVMACFGGLSVAGPRMAQSCHLLAARPSLTDRTQRWKSSLETWTAVSLRSNITYLAQDPCCCLCIRSFPTIVTLLRRHRTNISGHSAHAIAMSSQALASSLAHIFLFSPVDAMLLTSHHSVPRDQAIKPSGSQITAQMPIDRPTARLQRRNDLLNLLRNFAMLGMRVIHPLPDILIQVLVRDVPQCKLAVDLILL